MSEETKLPLNSSDVTAQLLTELRVIAPQVFTEDKVDFAKLQATLGENIAAKDERYGLSWAGKSEAFRNVQIPSIGTLLPQPEESVNFDNSENLIIEGDNLEVLKLLQKSYHGKVKMVYIDPPYNTGKEFIYPDNYHEGLDDYLKYSGQVNEEGQAQTSNTETSGRFHSKWLNMMYPRLFLARNLLRDDGVIFVSIGNDEIANLRSLLNEVFGEENFIEQIVWNKRIPKNDKGIGNIHEYILLYAKNALNKPIFKLPKDGLDEVYEFVAKLKSSGASIEEAESSLRKFYDKKGYDRGITLYNNLDDNFEIWGKINLSWPNGKTEGPKYEVAHPKTKNPVAIPDRGWRWVEDTFIPLLGDGSYRTRHDGSLICGEIWFAKDEGTQPSHIKYLKDVSDILLKSIISTKSDGGIETEELLGRNIFPYPKPSELLRMLVESCSLEKGDIILDFFAGSGTTAHAVLNLNELDGIARKFILVQLPEKLTKKNDEHIAALNAGFQDIADITRERVRRVIEQLNKQTPLTQYQRGFKAFKLTSSNFKIWNADATSSNATAIGEQLRLYAKNVERERTQQDILYELVLKSGLPLSAKVEQIDVAGKKIYSIAQSQLLICLENEVGQELLRGMIALSPIQMVCLDHAFGGNDQLKTNTVLEAKSQNVTFRTV